MHASTLLLFVVAVDLGNADAESITQCPSKFKVNVAALKLY
jgi:hypothetical protein